MQYKMIILRGDSAEEKLRDVLGYSLDVVRRSGFDFSMVRYTPEMEMALTLMDLPVRTILVDSDVFKLE